MPRKSPYSDAQKAGIHEAVKTARKTGTWTDAHKAAKDKGFKGSLPYLMKFIGGGKKRKGKAAPKAAPTKAKKLGRPKGSKNSIKRGPGRPKKISVPMNKEGLVQIDSIVERMVKKQVGATLSRAVQLLEAVTAELKSL